MDTLNHYREIIENVLTDIARIPQHTPDIEQRTIFDRRADGYVLIELGWEGARRVHHVVIHLEIRNGKVWIQEDNTDLNVAAELERAGIPKSDMVLGFQPPDVRPYTDYAVA